MPTAALLHDPMVLAAAALVALTVDRMLGEPPAAWHPVVWMGHYLQAVGQRIGPMAPVQGPAAARAFALGSLGWLAGAALCALAAWGIASALEGLQDAWRALALGLMLKPMLAWRMLSEEVRAVERALGESLQAGRARLARLVSRDVEVLDAVRVRESAIETLAENLNDSVVAPLFWFAVAGLPGAALYRFANTADAMWGYTGERQGRHWAWAGKWAARADDLMSWAPARLTACLLALAGAARGLGSLPAEARRTPSPNGGWPMGAMALLLGVRLGKPGVYELNASGRTAQAADTARALRLAGRAIGLLALVALLTIGWTIAFTGASA